MALILLNAFFAMTEIAVISVNDNKLAHQAESGDKRALRLKRLTDAPASFLATIQIGITLAGFLGSAFAADNFAGRLVAFCIARGMQVNPATLNTIAILLITVILSYFTLILGELVPKRIAMKHAERIALSIAGVISFFAGVVRPIVWLLTASTNGLLRLLGIDPEDKDEEVTEEEIRMMVDIGEESGNIGEEEKRMIQNVFEFNNMVASDVMTHRTDMQALWVDEDVDTLRSTVLQSGKSRFPVYGDSLDDIIGVVHVRDLLAGLYNQGDAPTPLRELVRPAYFVPESVATDVLFHEMKRRKTHMAIVVDEYGGTSGLVTMEDLLEEIVGSIYDEYDQEERDIEKLDEGTYRIRGTAALDEVSETLGVALPVDEYDTLGGLIYSQLNMIPEDGTSPLIEAFGLQIQVEEVADRRVEWAKVCRSS